MRFGKNGKLSSIFAARRLLTRDERGSSALHGAVGLSVGARVSMVPLSYVVTSSSSCVNEAVVKGCTSWVQCDDCDKWRVLADGRKVEQEATWVCADMGRVCGGHDDVQT